MQPTLCVLMLDQLLHCCLALVLLLHSWWINACRKQSV